MNKINYFSIVGFTALYVVTVFATAFLGYLHPFCWVGFPALAALLGAYAYYHVAMRWPKFGVGTLLGLVFGLFLLVTGEGDAVTLGIMTVAGVVLTSFANSPTALTMPIQYSPSVSLVGCSHSGRALIGIMTVLPRNWAMTMPMVSCF